MPLRPHHHPMHRMEKFWRLIGCTYVRQTPNSNKVGQRTWKRHSLFGLYESQRRKKYHGTEAGQLYELECHGYAKPYWSRWRRLADDDTPRSKRHRRRNYNTAAAIHDLKQKVVDSSYYESICHPCDFIGLRWRKEDDITSCRRCRQDEAFAEDCVLACVAGDPPRRL